MELFSVWLCYVVLSAGAFTVVCNGYSSQNRSYTTFYTFSRFLLCQNLITIVALTKNSTVENKTKELKQFVDFKT